MRALHHPGEFRKQLQDGNDLAPCNMPRCVQRRAEAAVRVPVLVAVCLLVGVGHLGVCLIAHGDQTDRLLGGGLEVDATAVRGSAGSLRRGADADVAPAIEGHAHVVGGVSRRATKCGDGSDCVCEAGGQRANAIKVFVGKPQYHTMGYAPHSGRGAVEVGVPWVGRAAARAPRAAATGHTSRWS